MTRHLLRLIWNRKRQNFLLTLEIFFSFLTVFGVVLFALHYANNARQPLGYQIERIWSLTVDRKESADDVAVKTRQRETYRQLLAALRELPRVEGVAAAFTGPYANSNWGGGMWLAGGRQIQHGVNRASDEFLELFHIPLVAGRWFSREDDAASWTPVVLNRRLAAAIFGAENPIGRIIDEERDPNDGPADPNDTPEVKRVIGVIDDFRQNGELSTAENYLFYRMRLDGPDPKAALPDRIFVRLEPGTPAAFEEALVKRAMAVATDWSFEVQPLETMRQDRLRQYAVPLLMVATIAAFLLLMVALGLTGVVWQGVTQRIREFGLRRAKGATMTNVRTQVLAEMVIMTSIALVAGVALVAQLPLLPLPAAMRVVPASVFLLSLGLSVAAIYLLTLACGWYPSRLATRVQPAEALHYE
ncbi:MAG: ABC transporter permease [Acidobacteriota bacterium]